MVAACAPRCRMAEVFLQGSCRDKINSVKPLFGQFKAAHGVS